METYTVRMSRKVPSVEERAAEMKRRARDRRRKVFGLVDNDDDEEGAVGRGGPVGVERVPRLRLVPAHARHLVVGVVYQRLSRTLFYTYCYRTVSDDPGLLWKLGALFDSSWDQICTRGVLRPRRRLWPSVQHPPATPARAAAAAACSSPRRRTSTNTLYSAPDRSAPAAAPAQSTSCSCNRQSLAPCTTRRRIPRASRPAPVACTCSRTPPRIHSPRGTYTSSRSPPSRPSRSAPPSSHASSGRTSTPPSQTPRLRLSLLAPLREEASARCRWPSGASRR